MSRTPTCGGSQLVVWTVAVVSARGPCRLLVPAVPQCRPNLTLGGGATQVGNRMFLVDWERYAAGLIGLIAKILFSESWFSLVFGLLLKFSNLLYLACKIYSHFFIQLLAAKFLAWQNLATNQSGPNFSLVSSADVENSIDCHVLLSSHCFSYQPKYIVHMFF